MLLLCSDSYNQSLLEDYVAVYFRIISSYSISICWFSNVTCKIFINLLCLQGVASKKEVTLTIILIVCMYVMTPVAGALTSGSVCQASACLRSLNKSCNVVLVRLVLVLHNYSKIRQISKAGQSDDANTERLLTKSLHCQFNSSSALWINFSPSSSYTHPHHNTKLFQSRSWNGNPSLIKHIFKISLASLSTTLVCEWIMTREQISLPRLYLFSIFFCYLFPCQATFLKLQGNPSTRWLFLNSLSFLDTFFHSHSRKRPYWLFLSHHTSLLQILILVWGVSVAAFKDDHNSNSLYSWLLLPS